MVEDGLISFIQSGREADHDVSLLQQEVLEFLCVYFLILKLLALPLQFIKFEFVLLSDDFLFLLKS